MGTKVNNLKKLIIEQVNVHEFSEIDNLSDLIDYSNYNNKFTMRFDHNQAIHNLPFYIYDSTKVKDKLDYFNNIIEEMKKLNCTLLCSNGYKYDELLKFNFVIEISDNCDFILELCDKKVPLRDMYKYKTTVIQGNLLSNINLFDYTNKNDNVYEQQELEYIINWIINLKVKYKYIEGTLYSKKVGIFNNELIIWQTY